MESIINALMGEFGYTRKEAQSIVDAGYEARSRKAQGEVRRVRFGKGNALHAVAAGLDSQTICGKPFNYSDDITTHGEVTCKTCLKGSE